MGERLAVVTGSSSGFGAAVVAALATAGWKVVATGRSPQEHRAGVTHVVWDVADDNIEALRAAVGDSPVHLVVNNAGTGVPGGPLDDVRVDDLLAVMDVNVGGVLRTVQALLPNLRSAGIATVVNVSSRLGSLHDQAAGAYGELRTSYAYRISKAAQNMASIAMAQGFGSDIRLIALHPGELAPAMGQDTARTPPEAAAQQLLDLLERDDLPSPAFVRATGARIDW